MKLFFLKKNEIVWPQRPPGQSIIIISTLSWSGKVLRHMVYFSSFEMYVPLWLVLMPESMHHPPSLLKHLFPAGVQSYVINITIWSNSSRNIHISTQRLHKQLCLVRDGWFLTEFQLMYLLKKCPVYLKESGIFSLYYEKKNAVGGPKRIQNRKQLMLIIRKNTQMCGYLPGLLYVKSTNKELCCKAKNNSFAFYCL